jgi:hypothetical protein
MPGPGLCCGALLTFLLGFLSSLEFAYSSKANSLLDEKDLKSFARLQILEC